jgi:adenylate cyclase
VNYGPEYRHGWGSRTYCSQLRLDPLPAESAGELLEVILGEDPGLIPLKQLPLPDAIATSAWIVAQLRSLTDVTMVQAADFGKLHDPPAAGKSIGLRSGASWSSARWVRARW